MQRWRTLLRNTGAGLCKAAPHLAPGTEATAATASLAAGLLTQHPTALQALQATSVSSGAAWAAGAIASELDNLFGDSPHSHRVSAANVLGVLAGALSVAGPVVQQSESAGLGFASASSWVASAAATAAGVARLNDTFAKVLQGGSALANGVAGALAALAAKASAEHNSQRAAMYTIASAALWLTGAAAAEGAVLRDRYVNAQANRARSSGNLPV